MAAARAASGITLHDFPSSCPSLALPRDSWRHPAAIIRISFLVHPSAVATYCFCFERYSCFFRDADHHRLLQALIYAAKVSTTPSNGLALTLTPRCKDPSPKNASSVLGPLKPQTTRYNSATGVGAVLSCSAMCMFHLSCLLRTVIEDRLTGSHCPGSAGVKDKRGRIATFLHHDYRSGSASGSPQTYSQHLLQQTRSVHLLKRILACVSLYFCVIFTLIPRVNTIVVIKRQRDNGCIPAWRPLCKILAPPGPSLFAVYLYPC